MVHRPRRPVPRKPVVASMRGYVAAALRTAMPLVNPRSPDAMMRPSVMQIWTARYAVRARAAAMPPTARATAGSLVNSAGEAQTARHPSAPTAPNTRPAVCRERALPFR